MAREKGQEYIDAEVVEGHVRAPLYATMTPQELLRQAEYAEFLRHTDLDRLRPDHDIRPTALGRYDEIWEQIRGHGEWLSAIWHRPATVAEMVTDWYDYIYCPIIDVIRQEESSSASRPHRGRPVPVGHAPPARAGRALRL